MKAGKTSVFIGAALLVMAAISVLIQGCASRAERPLNVDAGIASPQMKNVGPAVTNSNDSNSAFAAQLRPSESRKPLPPVTIQPSPSADEIAKEFHAREMQIGGTPGGPYSAGTNSGSSGAEVGDAHVGQINLPPSRGYITATDNQILSKGGTVIRGQDAAPGSINGIVSTQPMPLTEVPGPGSNASGGRAGGVRAKSMQGKFFHGGNSGLSTVVAPDAPNAASAAEARRVLENAPAGALPSRTDELWVIERHTVTGDVPPVDNDAPGTGCLMARLPNVQKDVAVPLKHTDVKASISGYIATVDVTQQYQNPYDGKIEAVYVFPLPSNAAVSEFVMTIGDRHIRGIIRDREQAKQIYEEAKSQGYVASLLTQERPNIFTQSIANIEPGKSIDIDIKYFNTLSYVDGWYEFVFPMVVGPRFNPPGSTEGVGAVRRGGYGSSGQATEVQYLKPTERSGHDIALDVKIDAGVPIEQIDSRNHRIDVRNQTSALAEVALRADDSIPNKDFVLRYKVAGGSVKSALMTHRDEKGGGYFTLMLYPPQSLASLPRKPLEMVFTIDVSGSQSGAPLAQEKAAVRYALTHMGPEDTFQVIRFGNTAKKLFPAPVAANSKRVDQALRYVDSLDATEGTMLVDGVHASLLFPHDQSRLRFVAFLTDGFIGNESEALSEIHKCLGPSRIFSFGVGSSTNRYLLDHMAKMGNGAAAYLGLNDDADDVMKQFFDRISHPAMTDVSVDFDGMQAAEVYPSRMPDLFVGRPVILTGRFEGHGKTVVHVHGIAGGEQQTIDIPVDLDDATATHKALPAVWARMKIADLADRATYEGGIDLPQEIRTIATEYGLMSSYTSFVAVDATARTSGESGTTIAVPVPVPDGVKYQTTVER